jgi:hypothetical protein
MIQQLSVRGEDLLVRLESASDETSRALADRERPAHRQPQLQDRPHRRGICSEIAAVSKT